MATVLVRVHKAARSKDQTRVLGQEDVAEQEWEKLGIVIPAPTYGSKAYDTTFCEPTSQEVRVYNNKGEKEDTVVSTVVHEVKR